MLLAFEKLGSKKGQGTVEAAFALPILMLLVLLLVQPSIVLYDRMIMSAAASEACRLYATAKPDVEPTCKDYVRRRLSAIPETDLFHVHSEGCTWNIEFGGGESSQFAMVSISTEVKPVPLIGSGMRFLGLLNKRGNITLKVESVQKVQPDWLIEATDGALPQDWKGI